VGSLVAEARRSGRPLREVAAGALAGSAPTVAARLQELLDPAASMRAKACAGGTAPAAVQESLQAALSRIKTP
jgi:argininosuccinate lyase